MLRFTKKVQTVLMILIAAIPLATNAAGKSPLDRLKSFGDASGYNTSATSDTDILEMVGSIVGTLLGLLGIIFIILIIYAGFNWMTAAGDETKLSKAKDTIQRAILGLIIIISAFAIWQLISTNLL